MEYICINPFLHPNVHDAVQARCISDWAHTQLQLLYAIYAWIVIVCIAVTWTVCARRQRRKLRNDQIGFSLYWRQWARTSRKAAIINRPVQLLVSSCIWILFVRRCSSYEVEAISYYIATALYFICIIDDIIRFFASRYKILYCFSLMTLVEVSCLVSHLYVRIAPTIFINGVPTRTWLDFSILRPIFIYRSFTEMESRFPHYSSKSIMLSRLSIRFLLLIVTGAAIMFVLETLQELPIFQNSRFTHLYECTKNRTLTHKPSEDCPIETWSIMYSFYFTVVTLGTVGYGDNAPKTVLSRLLVIIFIGLGVILFSGEIENLLKLYKLRQIGNASYEPKFQETKHIIVTGNPTYKQLDAVLKEFFHQDHDGELFPQSIPPSHSPTSKRLAILKNARDDSKVPMHVVVLAKRSSKCAVELIEKLEVDPLFASRVSFVAGDPTCEDDLERGRVSSAMAALIISDKLAQDAALEDSTNVMQFLAIRRYCGSSLRCLALVQRADTVHHLIAAGAAQEDIICEYLIKMGSMARSALAPGTCTLLANLAISRSWDMLDCTKHQSQKSTVPAKKSRHEYSHSHSYSIPLEMSVAAEEAFGDLDFERWQGQHDNLARSYAYNMHREVGSSNESESYVSEYYRGMMKEIYAIPLPHMMGGLTFADAAFQMYRESCGKVVMIAVEVPSSLVLSTDFEAEPLKQSSKLFDAGCYSTLLSPGNSLVMAVGMTCYVIADDMTEIDMCLQGYDMQAHERPGDKRTRFKRGQDWIDLENLTLEPHTESNTHENEMESTTSFVEFSPATASPLTRALLTKTFILGDHVSYPVFDRTRRLLAKSKVHLRRSGQTRNKKYTVVASLERQVSAMKAHKRMSAGECELQRDMKNSCIAGHTSTEYKTLRPPPLDVLLNPNHIVICSFLGEEGLPSLQWFIRPLRSNYAIQHPPITILDSTKPSLMLLHTLAAYDHVFYVRGSPLVYSDLQRAGAKAASSVIILGRRANRTGFRTSSMALEHDTSALDERDLSSEHVTSTVLDAETIFCSMLVEMKMDLSKIFTITELVDESNSKFLGLNLHFQRWTDVQKLSFGSDFTMGCYERKSPIEEFWDTCLSTGHSGKSAESEIARSPLYMSGRIWHPEFCESLLVQTFYEPTVHKIMQQLTGSSGTQCTGNIRMFLIPPSLFQIRNPCYGDVLQYYTDKSPYPGICMGLYRVSSYLPGSRRSFGLPIVLTAPDLDVLVYPQDRVFILFGHCTVASAACTIQRAYKRYVRHT